MGQPLANPKILTLQGLEALKCLDFVLKRKCTLFERSEFGDFRFAFSKVQMF